MTNEDGRHEKIEEDGTIIFTEPTIKLMKDFLGQTGTK
jgi:hypothetical protein